MREHYNKRMYIKYVFYGHETVREEQKRIGRLKIARGESE
jgi:hypothetical protein